MKVIELQEKLKNTLGDCKLFSTDGVWSELSESVIRYLESNGFLLKEVLKKQIGFEIGFILDCLDTNRNKKEKLFVKILPIGLIHLRLYEKAYSDFLMTTINPTIDIITTDNLAISITKQVFRKCNSLDICYNKNLFNERKFSNFFIKLLLKAFIFNFFDLKIENIVINTENYDCKIVDFTTDIYWKNKLNSDFKKFFKYNIDNLNEDAKLSATTIGNYTFFKEKNLLSFLIDLLSLGQTNESWIININSWGSPFYVYNEINTNMFSLLQMLKLNKDNDIVVFLYFKKIISEIIKKYSILNHKNDKNEINIYLAILKRILKLNRLCITNIKQNILNQHEYEIITNIINNCTNLY